MENTLQDILAGIAVFSFLTGFGFWLMVDAVELAADNLRSLADEVA